MDTKRERAVKVIAAISGVMRYLQVEQEAAALAAADSARPAAGPNMWSISGRMAHMNLRSMMQLKAFQGFGRR